MVWHFWYYIIMWVVSYVVGELLRPKPQTNNARPAGLGDFDFPTATEARPVPVAWGTVEIGGPNVVWYGDLLVNPIVKTITAGKQSVDQTVGYYYAAGIHFVLCHGPVDALLKIRANDKRAWIGEAMDETIYVDAVDLFGGDDREGGLRGNVNVWSGSASQGVDPYLNSHLTDVPAYRGVCSLVFKHFYLGTSTYIKPFKFTVRRIPTGLGCSHPSIDGDANPAEMLYELLTNAIWGCGLAAAQIDTASFLAAADTLYGEGLGLSLLWDNRMRVEEIAGEILRHIDGVLYNDIRTGKMVLKLARKDYVIGDLPAFNESNGRLENYSRTAWDETTNEVRVTYNDREAKFTQRTAAAQDLANWEIQGAVVSTQIQYPGISTAANAARLAMRDLKALTYPLAKGTMRCNRAAFELVPGAVFKLSWAPLGIEQMICRVLRPRFGELAKGEILVDFSQDVYAMADSIYAEPSGGWEEPASEPADVSLSKLVEMPYMVRLGKTTAPAGSCVPLVMAARPSGDAYAYDLWASLASAPYAFQGTIPGWTPTGTLNAAIGQADTSVVVLASGLDLDSLQDPAVQDQGASLFLLGDELLAYGTVTDNGDGTWTLGNCWRGLLDTVPVAHPAGDRAWFFAARAGWTQQYYEGSDSLNLKYLTKTGEGTLAIGSASAHNIIFAGRAEKPYPPGKVRINGQAYPTTITGEMTVAWAHRDRLQQTAYLIQQSADSIGPEDGTTYTLRIYGESDTLVHTETGLTGTTYTYPEATEISESGLGRLNNHLTIELVSMVSAIPSMQAQVREFDRAL